MPGRKKTPVASLFKDITGSGKVAKVKCLFCAMIVAKNGTRMMNHIRDCTKCDEMVKFKYLKPDFSKQNQSAGASGASGDISEIQSPQETPISDKGQRETLTQRPVESFFRSVTPLAQGTLESESGDKTLVTGYASSTPSKPKMSAARKPYVSQQSKINMYMDTMTDAKIVSIGKAYIQIYKIMKA